MSGVVIINNDEPMMPYLQVRPLENSELKPSELQMFINEGNQ